jgi:hypothetical protein
MIKKVITSKATKNKCDYSHKRNFKKKSKRAPLQQMTSLLQRAFGLDTVRGEEYLDVQLSFFRFYKYPKADRFYNIIIIIALLCVGISIVVELGVLNEKLDPKWLLELYNQVTLLTVFFFLLVLFNAYRYGSDMSSFLGTVPSLIVLQYGLFTVLFPLTIIALFSVLILHDSLIDSQLAAIWLATIFIFLFGMFGAYEADVRHIMLSSLVLFIHYAALEAIHPADWWFVLLSVIGNMGLHLFLVGFTKYKLYKVFNSLWRQPPVENTGTTMDPY